MSDPERHYEPMTPVQAEALVHALGAESRDVPAQIKAAADELEAAQKALISAKAALTVAEAKATLSPDAPAVGRGPGEVTVRVRDSWVTLQTLAEREAVTDADAAVRAARAKLDAAHEHRRSVREQLMAATAINASVREAYRGAGVR